MNKKQFFIHRTSCRVHNKKTEALSDILTRLNSTLVTFDDNPNNGEAVAHITLYPVTQQIIQDSELPHA